MSVEVKFRNKDKLFQSLKNTVPEVDKNLRDALAQGGDEMVQQAKSFVPKDEGDLLNSIEWEWTQNTQASDSRSPAIIVMAGDDKGGKADHAMHVELGTVKMARQPYFFPAYRLLKRKIKGRLTRSMTKAIKAAGF